MEQDRGDNAAASTVRDAVIFVPGLGPAVPQSIDLIARRVAAALNRRADTAEASFVLGQGQEEEFSDTRTRVVTVSRRDGNRLTPVLDLYEADYLNTLTGEFQQRSSFLQAMTIALLLLTNTPRMIKSMRQLSKTMEEKVQVIYGGLAFFGLAAYMVLLLFTVFATAADTLRSGQLMDSARQALSHAQINLPELFNQVKLTPNWLYALQLIALATGSLYLFSHLDLKRLLEHVATQFTAVIGYLGTGERSGAVSGQIAELIEHILEKSAAPNGVTYKDIHLMAYSFGSIVAIDSLFPIQQVSARFRRINAMVTIGCPFDLIRTYWPDYFSERCGEPGIPRRWINVYAPADVLASNFLDDGQLTKKERRALRDRHSILTAAGPAPVLHECKERGVGLVGQADEVHPYNIRFGKSKPLDEYGLIEGMGLIGFREHSRYWESDVSTDVSCFDGIVEELYRGTWVLA